jgi:hypothetical protein
MAVVELGLAVVIGAARYQDLSNSPSSPSSAKGFLNLNRCLSTTDEVRRLFEVLLQAGGGAGNRKLRPLLACSPVSTDRVQRQSHKRVAGGAALGRGREPSVSQTTMK